MRIACLHTTARHQSTFSALIAAQSPFAAQIHVVRDDLLAQAQHSGIEAVTDQTLKALGALSGADAVLCTCSTLGPLIDALQNDKFVRIDRPMMELAATYGPHPLLAICLESTRQASLELLQDSRGSDLDATVHLIDDVWPFFLSGNIDIFADGVASSIAMEADGHDCVILGQASMAVAEPGLADLGIPVVSAPRLAVAHTLEMAQR